MNKEGKKLRADPAAAKEGKGSLTAQYNSQLQKMETQSRELRQKQKQIKESHEEMIRQKAIFAQLDALMKMKLQVGPNWTR